jgi:uncharacterized membrane protein YeaQ/YmgE (transglycosylase-associated protein family)
MILLGWLFYGIIVGLITKAIYRGSVPSGFVSTLAVGIVGSFMGGFVRFLATGEGDPFQASGILMGVLGGILTCYLHKKFMT